MIMEGVGFFHFRRISCLNISIKSTGKQSKKDGKESNERREFFGGEKKVRDDLISPKNL